jgi:hypothetical protein
VLSAGKSEQRSFPALGSAQRFEKLDSDKEIQANPSKSEGFPLIIAGRAWAGMARLG